MNYTESVNQNTLFKTKWTDYLTQSGSTKVQFE